MPTTQSGFMIQSTYGGVGNLELVVPSRYGGLSHCWRNNDTAGFPWVGPTAFGAGDVDGVALIESRLGAPGPGPLEVVVRTGHVLDHYARSPVFPFAWAGPLSFAAGVSGNPALVQSRFGAVGNLEVVVPLEEGGLAHWWRNNDDPALPWIGPAVFAGGLGVVDAVALVHSTLDAPGTLEVVARVGDQLFHLWRDSGPPFAWTAPQPIFAGAAGVPAILQSTYGTQGNFELVTPLAGAGGGMAHLWCDTGDPARPWSAPTVFGVGLGGVSAVALVQSDLGASGSGNLELAARIGAETAHFYRETAPPLAWQGPTAFACPEPAYDGPAEGEWRVPYAPGVVGVHAALLHTGRLLFFSYEEHGGQVHGDSSVLDPRTGQVTRTPIEKNLFCSGQGFLADGRLLVAGGATTAVRALYTFTPNAEAGTWQDLGDLSDARWYPTICGLPDGRALILSGTKGGGGPRIDPHACVLLETTPLNDTYECFDPTAGTAGALQPPQPAPIVAEADPYCLFPFVFVLPTGKLLVHAGTLTRVLDLATETWDATGLTTQSATARTYPSTGTCVLLPLLPDGDPPYRARVLLIGGAGVSCPVPAGIDTPATATCELLDVGAAPLGWQPAAALPQPRVMPDAVLLPDGTVLVVNGSSTGVADNGVNPVLGADLYDPATDTWTPLAAMRVPRLYHSTALLLPDGRVLTAGKDEEFNPPPFNYPEHRVEVFSPPYLFRGPGPVITAAPAHIDYGSAFDVQTPDAGAVTAACLIRPGAVTHSFNPDQRYVGLALAGASGASGASVTVQAPPDPFVAPPGHYLLFLRNAAGVPSVATFVHVG
jgi:hypothetical protein